MAHSIASKFGLSLLGCKNAHAIGLLTQETLYPQPPIYRNSNPSANFPEWELQLGFFFSFVRGSFLKVTFSSTSTGSESILRITLGLQSSSRYRYSNTSEHKIPHYQSDRP
ncbi:hypothetical protein GALMADRAFT_258374 [Galerina marginata CBS 339.88]|uniref:Uncharacterized protein n=1 Tax=Galerina marginata (strain CBS 339.88) TaxID=685588 RepID=A0A067S9B1_GALM3|nr:hypothetical protein GALMADRAFT_258374 [Galerina marginata CBS 339.88]